MNNPEKLIQLFSSSSYRGDYALAKATSSCIICGRSAHQFRNESARLEYKISAMCQECQDKFFKRAEHL